MKAIKVLIAALGLMVILHACSSDEPSSTQEPTTPPEAVSNEQVEQPVNQEQKPSKEEQIASLKALLPGGATKIPETAAEIASFPIGRYAGSNYSEHEQELQTFLQELPAIENPDQEVVGMYYMALLGLFAEDYPDPERLIEDIKMASFGSPEIDDPRFQFKEQYNVEIILDASGSMAGRMDGKTKMDAAKEAIKAFAETLPKEANVALRVYGNEGSGKDSDKALSCSSSELVYQLQKYDAGKLAASLNHFQPTGWTPIAHSLQEAGKDLSQLAGDKNTNLIFLVSDGIETCGGDPVAAAKQLADSNITPVLNVIGFDVDGEGQKQLKAVAEAARGRYVSIRDKKGLQDEFSKAKEIADEWYKWRRKESSEAYSRKVNLLVNNTHYKLEWKFLADDEKRNVDWMIRQIKRDKRFPQQLAEELARLQDEHKRNVDKRADELEDMLDSLAKKSYKETIEAISEQYGINAGGN
ncbi:VWA domain-containing protein [Brevibacillus parabrevis]|uniref:vWA domain-containing protein n=1 Tax=Brevibacillus parabrevis TaxID=54914 RepID=UPI001C22FF79|nr:VWA domain-containing protein [Brevibacillus parabrevis]MBU8715330.1 VWA domain-containing protein [Brevibacillus parabrevis]